MAQTKPPEWALIAARKLYLRFVYGTERDTGTDAEDRRKIRTAAKTIEREYERG